MTRNVCVLGDSHVACIKVAWDKHFSMRADCSLTFFASPGNGIENLYVQDEALLPKGPLKEHLMQTSGGQDRIELNKYGCCLICGLTFRFPYDLAEGKFYSTSLKKQLCLDVFRSSRAYSLIKKIRAISDLRIWLAHVPLTVNASDESPGTSLSYETFVESFVGELDALNVTLLRQPAKTIIDDVYTYEKYTNKSRGLLEAGRHFPESDTRHMNEEYGKIVLADFLEKIGCRCADSLPESSRRARK